MRVFSVGRERENERDEECELTRVKLCLRVCAYVCVYSISLSLCVRLQDPPNGALECEVDGVATTTVITIASPVLMTDESGVTTLTYDAELVSMVRGGGPTAANMTAPAEAVTEEEVVMCDEDSGVSLFIDDVKTSAQDCPSPMAPAGLDARILCSASNLGGTTGQASCADGFQLLGSCPPFFCEKERS